MSINLDNVRRWTAALRSGEYEQTTSMLAIQDGDSVAYCCMGVGCVVAGPDEVPHETITYPSAVYGFTDTVKHSFGDGSCEELPPTEFHAWLGIEGEMDNDDVYIDWPEEYVRLSEGSPRGGLSRAVMSCANMNDSFNLTFEQIADMIDYFGIRDMSQGDA
jgi:hypothetical protein